MNKFLYCLKNKEIFVYLIDKKIIKIKSLNKLII